MTSPLMLSPIDIILLDNPIRLANHARRLKLLLIQLTKNLDQSPEPSPRSILDS